MKKLSLMIFIGMTIPYASYSQAIINIAGADDPHTTKEQVIHSLKLLDVHEPIHLYIVFSDLNPTNLKGITYQVPSSGPVHIIRVRINASLDQKQTLMTLAHEMLHVQQYIKGKLRVLDKNHIHWKGQRYGYTNIVARKNPWELEAYRQDQYLAKALEKVPAKAGKLASIIKP